MPSFESKFGVLPDGAKFRIDGYPHIFVKMPMRHVDSVSGSVSGNDEFTKYVTSILLNEPDLDFFDVMNAAGVSGSEQSVLLYLPDNTDVLTDDPYYATDTSLVAQRGLSIDDINSPGSHTFSLDDTSNAYQNENKSEDVDVKLGSDTIDAEVEEPYSMSYGPMGTRFDDKGNIVKGANYITAADMLAKIKKEVDSLYEDGLQEVDIRQAVLNRYGRDIYNAIFKKIAQD